MAKFTEKMIKKPRHLRPRDRAMLHDQQRQTAGIPQAQRDVTPQAGTSREIQQGSPQWNVLDDGVTDGEFVIINTQAQVLSKAKDTFVNKFMSEALSDETIDLNILDKYPIPELINSDYFLFRCFF